jgi:hypothetical protein
VTGDLDRDAHDVDQSSIQVEGHGTWAPDLG